MEREKATYRADMPHPFVSHSVQVAGRTVDACSTCGSVEGDMLHSRELAREVARSSGFTTVQTEKGS